MASQLYTALGGRRFVDFGFRISDFPPAHPNHRGTENTEKPQREMMTLHQDDLGMVLRWVGNPLSGSVPSVPLWFSGPLEPIGMNDPEVAVPLSLFSAPVAVICRGRCPRNPTPASR